MYSFQDQYTLFQNMSQDNTTASLTFGKQQINFGQRLLESEIGAYVTEDTRTGTTSSSTNVISLPENFIRLKEFYVTVGNIRYIGAEVNNEDEWQIYFGNNGLTKSDFLSRVLVRRNTIELFPSPASANTWTMIYEMASKDLSFADYTTGTASISNAATAVTGSGTTWTAAMANRYIKFSTDTQWYEISAFSSTTALTLKTAYQGASLSGVSYTIGECPRTPGPTHIIPVYYALSNYFRGFKKDSKFGDIYEAKFTKWMQWAKATYGNRYSQKVITPSNQQIRRYTNRNPNFFPASLTG